MTDVIRWIITKRAAENAIANLGFLFSERNVKRFSEGERNEVYNILQGIAEKSWKCRELNSIEFLVLPIKTEDGLKKVTYYQNGDIAFTTVVGNLTNQRLVTNIFSLKAKLQRIEDDRFQKNCSGRNPKRAMKHGYDEKLFRRRHGG